MVCCGENSVSCGHYPFSQECNSIPGKRMQVSGGCGLVASEGRAPEKV